MIFRAHYIGRKKAIAVAQCVEPAPAVDYWRTVHADSINEAVRIAERFTRKGYICCGVTQQVLNGKD